MDKRGFKPPRLPTHIAGIMLSDERFAVRTTSEKWSYDEEVRSIANRKAVFLSSKQVPSVMTLRGAGTRTVARELEAMVKGGFPLEQWYDPEGWRPYDPPSEGSVWSVSTRHTRGEREEEDLLLRTGDTPSQEDEFSYSLTDDDNHPQERSSIDEPVVEYLTPAKGRPTNRFRVAYEDPFKVIAALHLCSLQGKEGPRVYNWFGDVVRLQDNIPAALLGPSWKGSLKRGIPFFKIASTEVKLYVLENHTHWGRQLWRFRRNGDIYCRPWAIRLWKCIEYFLDGLHNPRWKTSDVERFYGKGYTPRPKESRATRFIQMLLTVDGVMVQRIMSDPLHKMSWYDYDVNVLGNISLLLQDEFFDGTIEDTVFENAELHYTDLKDLREEFKTMAAKNCAHLLIDSPIAQRPICRQFKSLILHGYLSDQSEASRMQTRGLLSQKRGMGTPPPLQVVRDKAKTLRTLTDPVEPLPKWKEDLLRCLVEQMISELPDEPFTGLATKAGITVSTASCYEHTGAEDGTAQAIQEIVWEGKHLNRPIRIIDLDTGEAMERKYFSEVTPGEYIFWTCLEYCLAMPLQELTTAFLVSAKEPSKSRTVTKGRACLKVVLNLVNGICSWPLGKAFESSESGMLKESHGWNLFRKTFSSWRDIVFDVHKDVEAKGVGTNKIRTRTYTRLFASSTDYKTATDWERHDVARIFGEAWMRKCGIPRLLHGFVVATCYQKRRIEFFAGGPLRNIGHATDTESVRYIVTERGILMGDPLTKPVLHLINIAVRVLAADLVNPDQLGKIVSNPTQVSDRIRYLFESHKASEENGIGAVRIAPVT